MTGRGKIGDGLKIPKEMELRELNAARNRLAMALDPQARTSHEAKTMAMKALSHALLYCAQRGGIPTTELVGFLRAAVSRWLPNGSRLTMSGELKSRLEQRSGMPQWLSADDRVRINAVLATIYKNTENVPATLQMSLYWDLLMRNAESIGLTHEALIARLEILDRLQRADGAPTRLYPDVKPSWAR